MRSSAAIGRLSAVIIAAAVLVAIPGAFLGGLGEALGPVVTSARGEQVLLYGRGLYEFDSRFVGAGNRATDVVVLFGGVPLLVASLAWYRHSPMRGGLLLEGTLAFFVYVYGTYSVGVAYNRLFPLYIVLLASSLFALVVLTASLAQHASNLLVDFAHHRALGVFMLASAAVLVAVWAVPLIVAMVDGSTPARLDTYATFVTYAIDLGTILPTAVIAGVLLLGRSAVGYVLAAGLLVIEGLLAPLIALQTLSQIQAGEAFTTAEMVGPVGGFLVLSVLAVFGLRSVLNAARLDDPQVSRPTRRSGSASGSLSSRR